MFSPWKDRYLSTSSPKKLIMLRTLFISCVFFICAHSLYAQIPQSELGSESFLLEEVEMLKDSAAQFQPEELMYSDNFSLHPLSQKFDFVEEASEVFWLRFRLKNSENPIDKWVLKFEQNWHYINVFVEVDSIILGPFKAGVMYSHAEKALPKRFEALIPLEIPAQTEVKVLVRMDYDKTHVIPPTTFATKVYAERKVIADEARLRSILNFFLGAFVIMFFFSSALFFMGAGFYR